MPQHANSNTTLELQDLISAVKATLPRSYDRSVNTDLSRQQWHGLLKRNVQKVLQQAYDAILAKLQDTLASQHNNALQCPTAAQLTGLCEELNHDLLNYAIQKHQASCALSNFPDEHRPAPEYVNEIIEVIETDRKDFIQQFNSLFNPG